MKDDLRERLLAEIARRTDVAASIYGYPQALRALRREVERHVKVGLRATATEPASTCCDFCDAEPWPCPTITDAAKELGVLEARR